MPTYWHGICDSFDSYVTWLTHGTDCRSESDGGKHKQCNPMREPWAPRGIGTSTFFVLHDACIALLDLKNESTIYAGQWVRWVGHEAHALKRPARHRRNAEMRQRERLSRVRVAVIHSAHPPPPAGSRSDFLLTSLAVRTSRRLKLTE